MLSNHYGKWIYKILKITEKIDNMLCPYFNNDESNVGKSRS
jgi:hypothetical protein